MVYCGVSQTLKCIEITQNLAKIQGFLQQVWIGPKILHFNMLPEMATPLVHEPQPSSEDIVRSSGTFPGKLIKFQGPSCALSPWVLELVRSYRIF